MIWWSSRTRTLTQWKFACHLSSFLAFKDGVLIERSYLSNNNHESDHHGNQVTTSESNKVNDAQHARRAVISIGYYRSCSRTLVSYVLCSTARMFKSFVVRSTCNTITNANTTGSFVVVNWVVQQTFQMLKVRSYSSHYSPSSFFGLHFMMTFTFTLYERQSATYGPAVLSVFSTTVTESHHVQHFTLFLLFPLIPLTDPSIIRSNLCRTPWSSSSRFEDYLLSHPCPLPLCFHVTPCAL